MAIRRTYYTSADAFASVVTADEARQWLKSEGFSRERIQQRGGGVAIGPSVDTLDDDQLALQVAVASTSHVRRRMKAGRSLHVRRDDGEWVSILAERVEAVGAKVVDDSEVEPGGSLSDPESPIH